MSTKTKEPTISDALTAAEGELAEKLAVADDKSADTLARIVAEREALEIEQDVIPLLRAALDDERATERAAAVNREASAAVRELAEGDAAVRDALQAVRETTGAATATIVQRDLAAVYHTNNLQNLLGDGDHSRVSVGRAGVTVDGKSLRSVGASVFVDCASALAEMADALGVGGYADALRNAARVGQPLTLPFIQEDETPKEKAA